MLRCLFAKKYFIFILKLYCFVILGSLQYLLEKTTLEHSSCQRSDKIRSFYYFRQICESEQNRYRNVKKLCSKIHLLKFWEKRLILFENDILIRFRRGYAKIENSTDFPWSYLVISFVIFFCIFVYGTSWKICFLLGLKWI